MLEVEAFSMHIIGIFGMYLTARYRIKDGKTKTVRALARMSGAVNFVWNYCCDVDRRAAAAWKAGRTVKRPSAFDLIKLCTGSSKELGLHSDTVGAVCQRFVEARQQCFPKTPKFRTRKGGKSLGWVPCSTFRRAAKLANGTLHFLKQQFRVWQSRDLPGDPKYWCIAEDARGRWYLNIVCDVLEPEVPRTGEAIGIDLGLKIFATCSDGTKIETARNYRKHEAALGVQQRAGNKARVKAIHAKIKNCRKHALHEASTSLARRFSTIVVGNVNASKLAKTDMAKSVFDASWTMFRNMLRYKALMHGAVFIEADERWTSRTCSCCGSIPRSSPKGMGALGMRHWVCSDCGASHDRDVNAARNILRAGFEREPLAGEILAL
jgi:IS605 OrfB family transposase